MAVVCGSSCETYYQVEHIKRCVRGARCEVRKYVGPRVKHTGTHQKVRGARCEVRSMWVHAKGGNVARVECRVDSNT